MIESEELILDICEYSKVWVSKQNFICAYRINQNAEILDKILKPIETFCEYTNYERDNGLVIHQLDRLVRLYNDETTRQSPSVDKLKKIANIAMNLVRRKQTLMIQEKYK